MGERERELHTCVCVRPYWSAQSQCVLFPPFAQWCETWRYCIYIYTYVFIHRGEMVRDFLLLYMYIHICSYSCNRPLSNGMSHRVNPNMYVCIHATAL